MFENYPTLNQSLAMGQGTCHECSANPAKPQVHTERPQTKKSYQTLRLKDPGMGKHHF
jgi:hypothetical protein